jgi:hypothetical protein
MHLSPIRPDPFACWEATGLVERKASPDIERPHAELAHVAQRHRLDPLVEAVSHQQQIVSIVATRVAKATVKHAMETPNLP